MALTLTTLSPDVLLCIFAFADVSSVLSLSRVNRHFHALTFSKHLWLSLVRDLASRGLIDAPPDELLHTLSKDALIDEIKRVIVGPRTWSSNWELLTIARQLSLPLPSLSEDSDPPTVLHQSSGSVHLLPGGRHALLYTGTSRERGLACYGLHSTRCVWEWRRLGWCVGGFAWESNSQKGETAVACIGVSDGNENHSLLVLQINLTTGESRELFHFAPEHAMHLHDLELCGDHVAAKAQRRAAERVDVLLLNWRRKEFILFPGTTCTHTAFALFPGHIVLAQFPPTTASSAQTSMKSKAGEIRLYSFASLAALGRPASEFSSEPSFHPGGAPDTPPVSLEIPLSTPCSGASLHVAQNPLRDDSYDLVVEETRTEPALTEWLWTESAPPASPSTVFTRFCDSALVNRMCDWWVNRDTRDKDVLVKVVSRYRLEIPSPLSLATCVNAAPKLTLISISTHPNEAVSAAGWTLNRRWGKSAAPFLHHPAHARVLPVPTTRDISAPSDVDAHDDRKNPALTRSGALVAVRPDRVVVSWYL
ncbi:hypothetical protein C8R43DRAFT_1230394 [Mycena crocata]|nr:hypothetical protein C8R43DRAFT_1230394 [Mycena crocata]